MRREELSEFLNRIPFNAYLGIRLVEIHRNGITIACDLRPELLNNSGTLHGGVTAALADVAVGVALSRLAHEARATTTELKINYLRPVSGGTVNARSHLLKVGKSLAVGRVDLSDGAGRLIGAALVSYMLLK